MVRVECLTVVERDSGESLAGGAVTVIVVLSFRHVVMFCVFVVYCVFCAGIKFEECVEKITKNSEGAVVVVVV